MRKALLIFLIVSIRSFGQCDSTYLRTTAAAIYSLHLFDTSNMIAVGDNGDIIRTTDGGLNWSKPALYKPFTSFLRDLHFPTADVGYAVGWGLVCKTEDGGKSWFPIPGNFSNLQKVYFIDANKGFVLGSNGEIFSTRDGGRNWSMQQFYSQFFTSIAFASNNTGFIGGYDGFVIRTTDGGASWTRVNLGTLPYGSNVSCIKFYDNKLGYVATSQGTILKTTDGGSSWITLERTVGVNIYDIYIHDENTALFVGEAGSGFIRKTIDGGQSWVDPFYTYPARNMHFYAVAADPLKKKIVVAGSGGAYWLGHGGRSIVTTKDLGETWRIESANFALDFYATQFINDSTGYIAGQEGMAFKTTDWGETWKPLGKQAFASSNTGIAFLDEQYGFLLNDSLYRTIDGAKNWKKINKPWDGPALQPYMQFVSPSVGFLADAYSIYKTVDSGNAWSKVCAVRESSFFLSTGVTFYKNKGYVVGYDGMVMRSTDSGSTWSNVSLNTNRFLISAYFYNDSLGFIGTSDSVIFRTIDGGTTWNEIQTNIHYLKFTFFKFENDSVGYMVGDNRGGTSGIYKTKDRGLTWSYVGGAGNIAGIQGTKTMYFPGGGGLILKTEKLTRPGIPGYLTGGDSSCLNKTTSYALQNIPGLEYNWSLSGGGTHQSNGATDAVTWNQPGVHQVSVSSSNACGQSPARVWPVEVIDYKPSISKTSDTVLTATPGKAYLWEKNGAPIPAYLGGEAQSLVVHGPGVYKVRVTNYMECIATSDPFSYVLTAINDPELQKQVRVFPSVTKSKLNVRIENGTPGKLQLKIFNVTGVSVRQVEKVKFGSSFSADVDVSNLPAGVYFLQVKINKQMSIHRFVVP